MAETLGGDTEPLRLQPPFGEDLPAIGYGCDEENMSNVRHLLVERMDTDFGLLDRLLQLRALTYPETGRIKCEKSIFDRNDKLLELIFKKMKHRALLAALTDTGQKHLFNLVKGNGGYRSEYGTVWPLREKEIEILDLNRLNLVDVVDPCDLITRMFCKSVITDRQQRYINSLHNSTEKTEVLLDILRRGSEEYYWKTVSCLQESNQSEVAEILVNGGVLAQVHVSNEGETQKVNEEEDHIFNTFVNVLQNITLPQYQRIRERLDLHIMQVKKGQSIVLYIYCKTLEELLYLYELLTKGEFKKCIATVFDLLILKRETMVSAVNWSEEEFTRFKTYFEGKLQGDEEAVKQQQQSSEPPKQRKDVQKRRGDEDIVTSQKKSLEFEGRIPECTTSVIQQLDDLIECSIHGGTYENPRQLPCLHCFCLQCLENYTKDKPLANNITCPLCRRKIRVPADGIEGFPRNFFIDKIIEIRRQRGPLQEDTLCDICKEDEELQSAAVLVASMFCIECRKNLCDRCTKEHRRQIKSHSVLKIGSEEINEQLAKKLEVSFCSDHSDKTVEMFCFDCQAVICMMCFAEKHKLHNCSDINNSAKDFRKQMEREIKRISVCLSEGEKSKDMIDKSRDDFLQQIKSVEKNIFERSEELRRNFGDLYYIDRDSNLLLNELKIIKASHLKEMQIQDEEIQRHLTIIASLKAFGKEIVAIDSASDICRSVNKFRTRTKEVLATVEEEPICEVVYRNVSFRSTEFEENLERNILGQLEVNCEKRLVKDLSDPEKSLQKTINVKPGKKESSIDVVSASGNKSEYDNESQGIQSPGAATTGSYPPQQPTKPRRLMHYILMDEDAYKYIQRFLHQDLEDLKALCNCVQELRDESSNFYLGYKVKYEFEEETVRRRFQMLIDQVKVEEYNAPDMVSASVLESVVHASVKLEGTMTFVLTEKNSLKIVGRPHKVDQLKKHIEETVSEQLLSQKQLSKENTHTYYSEQPCKQQSGTKFYHHLPIDENQYTYISVHCQQEIERASALCTSLTSSQKGSTFTIDFELQDFKDEGFVKRILENLIGQFKIEECRVPKGIDVANLASVVKEMNTSKEVMIFPHEDKQLLKLIGPNTQVSKTKKWIETLISDTIQSEQLSKQKPYVTNPNVHSSPITDQPASSKQSIPLVSTSLQKGNPVAPPRKLSERFKITSTTADSLTYESKRVKNQLILRVHHANIVKQKTDVLVSCEDEWLQGFTCLALAMKESAGPDAERELANISKNHGALEVGQVVHTSAGKLRPSVKYLVHAVRAQRSQYHPEDPKNFEILYKTFLNCLKYTNDKICQKSISIPPIGLHEYGVKLVSTAFSQAVEEYDAIAEATRSIISLRSIHFVDQDPTVVRQMITSMKSLLE